MVLYNLCQLLHSVINNPGHYLLNTLSCIILRAKSTLMYSHSHGLMKWIIGIALLITSTESYTQSFSPPPKQPVIPSTTPESKPFSPRVFYFGSNKPLNGKYTFTIVFNDGSSVEKKAAIDIKAEVHTIKWKENSEKYVITPNETKEIFRMDEGGKKIKGIPMDSCWAFRVGGRRIITYSVTSDVEAPTIAFIQNGREAPIVPLTKENLEPMVAGNEKAFELVQKGKLLKAVDEYNDF